MEKLGFSNVNKKDDYVLVIASLMDGGGFEPPKALLTDLQSAPFGHSGTHPFVSSFNRLDIYNTLFSNAQHLFLKHSNFYASCLHLKTLQDIGSIRTAMIPSVTGYETRPTL